MHANTGMAVRFCAINAGASIVFLGQLPFVNSGRNLSSPPLGAGLSRLPCPEARCSKTDAKITHRRCCFEGGAFVVFEHVKKL